MAKKSRTDIETLIDTIVQRKVLLARPIEEVATRNRAGHEILRRSVSDELPQLMKDLRVATIPHRLIGVFATGDADTISAAAATIADGGLVIAADEVWRKVADPVETSLGPQRRWGVHQWYLVQRGVAEVARELGHSEMQSLPNPNEIQTTDVDGLVDEIRKIVAASTVADIQVRYIEDQLVRAVCDNRLTATAVPVLVVGASEDERRTLVRFFVRSQTHVFEPGAETDEAALTKIFRAATPN